MKIVIQCAAKKDPNAGYLLNGEGKPVLFVATRRKPLHLISASTLVPMIWLREEKPGGSY